jgi:hypothetical protein
VLHAQWSGTLEVGVARVHYEEFLPSGAASLAPVVRYDGRDLQVVAAGALTRFESENLNGHGMLAASWFAPLGRRLRLEVAGVTSGSAHQTVGSSGMGQGQLRLHALGARRGLWLGGGAGITALGGRGRGSALGEVGGWVGADGLYAQLLARPVATDGLRYADTEAAARWRAGPMELGAQGGLRWGDATAFARSWLGADLALWVRPRLAFTASGGRWLSDPAAGSVGGRQLSFGVRVATRPSMALLAHAAPVRSGAASGPVAIAIPPPERPGTPPASALAFDVVPMEDGQHRLHLLAPEARDVEVIGDFTDWTPVPLRRADGGRWEGAFRLTLGVHRVNVRVNGGPWRVPPGLAATPDDFDGEVGLLVVREPGVTP